MTNKKTDLFRHRRRFMVVCTAFCMLTVAYVLYFDKDTEAARTAVSAAFFTMAGTLSAYVFGASWQHIKTIGAGNVDASE